MSTCRSQTIFGNAYRLINTWSSITGTGISNTFSSCNKWNKYAKNYTEYVKLYNFESSSKSQNFPQNISYEMLVASNRQTNSITQDIFPKYFAKLSDNAFFIPLPSPSSCNNTDKYNSNDTCSSKSISDWDKSKRALLIHGISISDELMNLFKTRLLINSV